MTPQELQSLRNLGGECETAADEIDRLHADLAAAQADAALYRWLRDNPTKWSWQPNANVYRGKVVGFCAHDTQYFDFTFEDALNFALAAKEKA